MKGCGRRLSSDRGFTLVEVLVALVILLVGVFSVVALIDVATGSTLRTRAREAGTNLARELTEAARGIPYDRLTKQSIQYELESQPGLNDSSPGGGWTIRRREFTYKITANVCSVDDPSDGRGQIDAGGACPGEVSGSSGDVDTSDYKRVEVTVSWTRPPDPENSVTQSTIVNNPGNATGPTIDSLSPTVPPLSGSPLKITDSRTEQRFDLTTSNTAATVAWSVDGSVQGDAAGSVTSWNFTWELGSFGSEGYVYDGTHQVGARAFVNNGVFGPLRSVNVTLNRRAPVAPLKFAGGRNDDSIEFEWLPNPEGDITGYRVYRLDGNGDPVGSHVCATENKTACLIDDPSPGEELEYGVLALDLDNSGQVEEGDMSTATVRVGNNPPDEPSGLSAQRVDDVTTLDWSGAEPADPDGDELLFYRIYRDGTAYEDRYDITGSGTETTYTDTRTDGVEHTYWVTAVDEHLGESQLVGPVEL